MIQSQEGNYYLFKIVQNDSKLIQREINMIQTYFNVMKGELLEIKTQLKVIQTQKGNQSLFKLSLDVIQAIFMLNGS